MINQFLDEPFEISNIVSRAFDFSNGSAPIPSMTRSLRNPARKLEPLPTAYSIIQLLPSGFRRIAEVIAAAEDDCGMREIVQALISAL
jgi:hypothetical protein